VICLSEISAQLLPTCKLPGLYFSNNCTFNCLFNMAVPP